jgi:hypothetical protein
VLRVGCAAVVAVAVIWAVAPVAAAHQGNPNFRSKVSRVTPPIDRLEVQVVNFDDSLELRNRTGRTVVVEGYRGERYLRIAADGTVSVNHRSPTYYLNEDRFAEGVKVPPEATPKATPDWHEVDRVGRYTWHDHRIHWMAHTVPPQVKDGGKRTKVFDWKIPIRVGTQPATIAGSLVWVGKDDSGIPVAAVIALVAVALAGLGLVLVVRRRRRRPAAAAPAKEAW